MTTRSDESGEREQLESDARRYLSQQLGRRAPTQLRFETLFDERPLENEGATALFSFHLEVGSTCGRQRQKHFVAVGQTEPNYFPAFQMDDDDAYSFHVGTRFMLTMRLGLVDAEMEPPGAREAMHRFVESYAAGLTLESEEVAALLRCDEACFAVYRLKLSGAAYYCLGADCPSGFYPVEQLAPQTVLRLHLGRVIRREARQEPT